jgi:hypothetical protein
MPSIVTADELRDVLGVSVSLFSDVYLDQIIDSAELTILPMLTAYESAVTSYDIKSNTIFFTTQRVNNFVEGQSVIVANCGATANGTYTVNSRIEALGSEILLPYTFSATKVTSDTLTVIPVIPAGTATLSGASAAEIYAGIAPIQSAILVVSVEIFQSVTAPGNMTNSVDFNPSPFVLGRSLQNRVIGLLSAYIDVETICQ